MYAYYTTTPQQFFDAVLPSWLSQAGGSAAPIGTVEFSLVGQGGGNFWVDFEAGEVSREERAPHCIVRAEAADFMALVEGRMSVTDGLLSERLGLAGEAVRLSFLTGALERLARR